MFADVIASVIDTIIKLQRQIKLIRIFCESESVGMILNLLKTIIIVFCNGGIVKQT